MSTEILTPVTRNRLAHVRRFAGCWLDIRDMGFRVFVAVSPISLAARVSFSSKMDQGVWDAWGRSVTRGAKPTP